MPEQLSEHWDDGAVNVPFDFVMNFVPPHLKSQQILSLKEAIDELESPFVGRKQILPPAVAHRIRADWVAYKTRDEEVMGYRQTLGMPVRDVTSAYEMVTQLLDLAVAQKNMNNKHTTRFMADEEGGKHFWDSVAKEVPWAVSVKWEDLCMLVSLCVRHYIRGDQYPSDLFSSNSESDSDSDSDSNSDSDDEVDPRVQEMLKAAKKWCNLLSLPDELRSIDGHYCRLNISQMQLRRINEEFRDSDDDETERGQDNSGTDGDDDDSGDDDSDDDNGGDSSSSNSSADDNEERNGDEDEFVSEGEAERLRQLALSRWQSIQRFSGDTVVDEDTDETASHSGHVDNDDDHINHGEHEGEAGRLHLPMRCLSGSTMVDEDTDEGTSDPGHVDDNHSDNDREEEDNDPNTPWNAVNDLEVLANYQATARELGSTPRPGLSRFKEMFEPN